MMLDIRVRYLTERSHGEIGYSAPYSDALMAPPEQIAQCCWGELVAVVECQDASGYMDFYEAGDVDEDLVGMESPDPNDPSRYDDLLKPGM